MKLQDQVCSLGSAKRLEELGVKQESLFWWFPFGHGIHRWQITDHILGKTDIKGWKHYEKNNKDFEFYSAFTCSELGDMLPEFIKQHGTNFVSVSRFKDSTHKEYLVSYRNKKSQYDPITFLEKSEAEARAKMLIYLIENKLLDPRKEHP